MKHPILGDITQENGNGDGLAHVSYGDRTIEILIIPDDVPYEQSIELAASVVRQLAKLDDDAKRVAATDLTDGYNNGWNEYDEVQEDGSLKAVVNPKLSKEAFAQKLTLLAINVTGTMLDFFYDDENMFWGHCLFVNSMNGIDLTDAHAEIFG